MAISSRPFILLLCALVLCPMACTSVSSPTEGPRVEPEAVASPSEPDPLHLTFDREAGKIRGRLLSREDDRLEILAEGWPAARSVALDHRGDAGDFTLELGADLPQGGQAVTLTLRSGNGDIQVFERFAPYLRVSLHPGDIVGRMQPARQVQLALFEPGEALPIGRAAAATGESGRFSAWILDDAGRRLRPEPGQRVRATDGDSQIELTIAELDASPDLAAGRLDGMGLPGADLELVMWNPWRPGETAAPSTQVNAAGRWQVSPEVGLHPASHFYITEHLPSGDLLYLCRQIPMLYVSPGSPLVEVQTLWEVEAELWLMRDGQQLAEAGGGGAWSGNLELVLRDAAGETVAAAPGDLIRARLDGLEIEVEVGRLEAEIDAASGRINGRAEPESRIDLARPEQPLERSLRADAKGFFSIDAEDLLAAEQALPGSLLEVYYRSPGGHTMRRRFVGLAMAAELGGRRIEGRAEPGARLRVWREAKDGGADTLAAEPDLAGYWQVDLPLTGSALAAGDRIGVEAGSQSLEIEVPKIGAELEGERISGQAPADSLLDIAAFTAERQPPIRLSASSDARGQWSANLQDRGNGLAGVEPDRLKRVEISWREGAVRLYRNLLGAADGF